MGRFVELPLIEPIYSTYHFQGMATATLGKNPSIRNWYLNQIMILRSNRAFLHGLTTPEITIKDSSWVENPHLEKQWFSMRFANGYINPIIRELLNQGYYVVYEGADDYYIQGKTVYKERHMIHDGLICGYNQEDKTYCIYAYDSNWVYQKFWTPQACFNAGRVAAFKKGEYGLICGIKPHPDNVQFSPETACETILEYLDSDLEKYPMDGEGDVYGIIVHAYIAAYVDRLMDGTIPHARTDRRVFRMLWEQKVLMLERIIAMEQALHLDHTCSEQYKPLVATANTMRMLYASHHMKRRDSILPTLRKNLLTLMESEREILLALTDKVGKELKKCSFGNTLRNKC